MTFPVGSFRPLVMFGTLGVQVKRSLEDFMDVIEATVKLTSSMF